MQYVARALVAASLVWVLALFLAPVAVESSSPVIAGSAAFVYTAGGFVCHQRPERSFHRSGRPLPVCARCTGLYVSALGGGILALALSARAVGSGRARWLLILASAPTAVTWTAEIAGLIQPPNVVRAVAAIPLGAAAAWLVVVTLHTRVSTTARTSHGV